MAETYPETWIGVAVHNGDPMTNTEYDNAIPSIIPNFPGYPSGTLDRAGDNYYDPSEFEAGYMDRMQAISPASLDILNFELDTVSRVVTFIVESEFIVDVNNELRFAAIISEDSLYGTSSGWNQANYYSGGSQGEMCGFEIKPDPIPAAQMVYNHVARVILDTPYGTTGSIVGPVLAGSIQDYTYTYTIPAEWRLDKLHYTGVLIDMSNGEILNSNNVLGGHFGIAENIPETSVNVYPNPFSNFTNVVFNLKKAEKVQLTVCNSIGGVVYTENAKLYGSGENKIRINSENLSYGFYFVKLTIGNKTITKKISVIR